jgi:hypothetical protein
MLVFQQLFTFLKHAVPLPALVVVLALTPPEVEQSIGQNILDTYAGKQLS